MCVLSELCVALERHPYCCHDCAVCTVMTGCEVHELLPVLLVCCRCCRRLQEGEVGVLVALPHLGQAAHHQHNHLHPACLAL